MDIKMDKWNHKVKKLKKRKVVEKWYRLTSEIFRAAADFDTINKHLKTFVDNIEQSEKMRRDIIKGTTQGGNNDILH